MFIPLKLKPDFNIPQLNKNVENIYPSILPKIRPKTPNPPCPAPKLKTPVLTAGGSAGSEDLLDLRVHHDADLSFVLYPTVSSIYFFTNPVLEFLANEGPDDVADVGAGQLENLFSLTGQGPHGFSVWVAFCVLDKVFDRQVIEVGHLDHVNLITADAPSLV